MIKMVPNLKLKSIGGKGVSAKANQPILLNPTSGEYLILQGLPMELSYSPETQVATIASVGRNNARYQPTSSEDTLKFSISYYATEDTSEDVIRSCKWVESLTKNDGYLKGHPEVMLIWGSMYSRAKFIVISAPYTARLFDRANGMKPKLATQEITLKRVTEDNLTHKDINTLDL